MSENGTQAATLEVEEPKEAKEKSRRVSDPDRRPAKQVSDPELIAMHEISEVFGELDIDAQRRVARWLGDRWAKTQESVCT